MARLTNQDGDGTNDRSSVAPVRQPSPAPRSSSTSPGPTPVATGSGSPQPSRRGTVSLTQGNPESDYQPSGRVNPYATVAEQDLANLTAFANARGQTLSPLAIFDEGPDGPVPLVGYVRGANLPFMRAPDVPGVASPKNQTFADWLGRRISLAGSLMDMGWAEEDVLRLVSQRISDQELATIVKAVAEDLANPFSHAGFGNTEADSGALGFDRRQKLHGYITEAHEKSDPDLYASATGVLEVSNIDIHPDRGGFMGFLEDVGSVASPLIRGPAHALGVESEFDALIHGLGVGAQEVAGNLGFVVAKLGSLALPGQQGLDEVQEGERRSLIAQWRFARKNGFGDAIATGWTDDIHRNDYDMVDAFAELVADPLNFIAPVGAGIKAAKTLRAGTRIEQGGWIGRAAFDLFAGTGNDLVKIPRNAAAIDDLWDGIQAGRVAEMADKYRIPAKVMDRLTDATSREQLGGMVARGIDGKLATRDGAELLSKRKELRGQLDELKQIERDAQVPREPEVPQAPYYHGSRQALPDELFREGGRAADNLLGPGLYLTDSPTVGRTYTFKGAEEGASGVIHGFDLPPNLKLADAESALPAELAPAWDQFIDELDAWGLDLSEQGVANLREGVRQRISASRLYSILKEELQWFPQSEVDEIFHRLTDLQQSAGFDGFRYAGGVRTGGEAHNPIVLFDPSTARRVHTTPLEPVVQPVAPELLEQMGRLREEIGQVSRELNAPMHAPLMLRKAPRASVTKELRGYVLRSRTHGKKASVFYSDIADAINADGGVDPETLASIGIPESEPLHQRLVEAFAEAGSVTADDVAKTVREFFVAEVSENVRRAVEKYPNDPVRRHRALSVIASRVGADEMARNGLHKGRDFEALTLERIESMLDEIDADIFDEFNIGERYVEKMGQGDPMLDEGFEEWLKAETLDLWYEGKAAELVTDKTTAALVEELLDTFNPSIARRVAKWGPVKRGLFFGGKAPQGSSISLLDADVDAGLETMRRGGQVLGLSEQQIDFYANRFITAKGRAARRRVVEDWLREGIDALPSERLREAVGEPWKTRRDSRYVIDAESGEPVEGWQREVVENGVRESYDQPLYFAQLMDSMPLPDFRRIEELNRLGSRLDAAVEAATHRMAAMLPVPPSKYVPAGINAARSLVVGATRTVNALTTALWAPLQLYRLAWAVTTTVDDQARAALKGAPNVFTHPAQWWHEVRAGKNTVLPRQVDAKRLVPHPNGNVSKFTRIGINASGGVEGWFERLRLIHADPVGRYMAQHGKQATKTWLTEGAGKQYLDAFSESVLDETRSLDVWLDNMEADIKAYTNAPGLKEAVVTGQWKAPIDDLEEAQMLGVRWQDEVSADEQIKAAKFDRRLDKNYAERKASDKRRRRRHARDAVNRTFTDSESMAAARKQAGVTREKVTKERWSELTQRKETYELEESSRVLDLNDPASEQDFIEWLGKHVNMENATGLRGAKPPTYVLPPTKVLVGDTAGPIEKMGRRLDVALRNGLNRFGGTSSNRLARAPMLDYYRKHETARLVKLGYSQKVAAEMAEDYAIRQTVRTLFDTGDRSRFAQRFNHLAPFFGAQEEIVKRWLFEFPNAYGAGLGQAYLLQRMGHISDVLIESGVAERDPETGLPNITIPFVDDVFEFAFGKFGRKVDLPEYQMTVAPWIPLANFPLSGPSLSMVAAMTERILPNMGPLTEAAKLLNPYGPSAALSPSWAADVWTGVVTTIPGIGDNIPLDFFNATYRKKQIEATKVDWLRAQEATSGRLSAIGKLKTKEERDAALAELMSEADEAASALFAYKGLMKFTLPGQGRLYWKGQEDGEAFQKAFYAAADSETRDRLKADNPELWSYLTAKTFTTKNYEAREDSELESVRRIFEKHGIVTESGDDLRQFTRELYRGDRLVDAKKWASIAQGEIEHQHIRYEHQEALEKVGATAVDWLTNYHEYRLAGERRSEALVRLGALNPEWRMFNDERLAGWREEDAVPMPSFEEAQILEAARLLKRVDALYDADGEVDRTAATKVLAGLRELVDPSQFFSDDELPAGPERDLQRYYQKAYVPYLERIAQTFEGEETLTADQFGRRLENLRKWKNEQPPVTIDGVEYPSPEYVQHAALSPEERNDREHKWAAGSYGWLSNFQREQLGLKTDQATQDFWDVVNETERRLSEWRAANNLSPNEKAYRDQKEAVEKWKGQLAVWYAKLGYQHVYTEFQVDQAAPYERVRRAGIVQHDYFNTLNQVADNVWTAMNRIGKSPESNDGRHMVEQFTDYANRLRLADPEFAKELNTVAEFWQGRNGRREGFIRWYWFDMFL